MSDARTPRERAASLIETVGPRGRRWREALWDRLTANEAAHDATVLALREALNWALGIVNSEFGPFDENTTDDRRYRAAVALLATPPTQEGKGRL